MRVLSAADQSWSALFALFRLLVLLSIRVTDEDRYWRILYQ